MANNNGNKISLTNAAGGLTNDKNNSINALKENVKSLMSQRYKNDPNKANTEYQKLIQALMTNEKTMLKLEKEEKAKSRKEDIENQKKIAKLQGAAATNFKDGLKATGAELSANLQEAGENLKDYVKNAAANFMNSVSVGIDTYANMYSQYSSKINARLQTFSEYQGEAFNDLSKLVRKNLAASPFIKQEKMLENLDTLIAQGINYNLEQRAFLVTVTDKIVTTFNALDETLLRMVRLQQMDTTQARMGMEAQLTKYLNSTYEDTSYLNNLYDTVASNLFEASSQLGRNASIELEYVVN